MRSRKSFSATATAVAVVLGLLPWTASPSSAGVIISAAGATADQATRAGSFALANLSNQSGLSIGFVSGVTDFDSYIASAPTHVTDAASMWGTNNGVFAANITFDLGGVVTLESFALWNRGNSLSQGTRNFNLTACADSACSSSALLGSYQATAYNTPNFEAPAEVFAFGPTSMAFLRLEILNVYGTCCITLSEVAFEQAIAVPAPASLALMGIGLAGLGHTLRRRTR